MCYWLCELLFISNLQSASDPGIRSTGYTITEQVRTPIGPTSTHTTCTTTARESSWSLLDNHLKHPTSLHNPEPCARLYSSGHSSVPIILPSSSCPHPSNSSLPPSHRPIMGTRNVRRCQAVDQQDDTMAKRHQTTRHHDSKPAVVSVNIQTSFGDITRLDESMCEALDRGKSNSSCHGCHNPLQMTPQKQTRPRRRHTYINLVNEAELNIIKRVQPS